MLSLNEWCLNNSLVCASNCNELLLDQIVLVKYQMDSSDDLLWKRARIISKDELLFYIFYFYIN